MKKRFSYNGCIHKVGVPAIIDDYAELHYFKGVAHKINGKWIKRVNGDIGYNDTYRVYRKHIKTNIEKLVI